MSTLPLHTMPMPLPVARLHFTVQADAPLQWPPYAGSMLRGALGHALQSLALLPHHNGQPCALHTNCPYCQIFATPALPTHSLQKFSQMPAPYVIEPPMFTGEFAATDSAQFLQAGQTFVFGLVLMGKAFHYLPTIILAFERALKRGLGGHHAHCTLLTVEQEGGLAPLWQSGQAQAQCQPPETTLPMAPVLGTQATLHLQTPLRLQYQNRPADQNNLNAYALLMALARRYQLLLDVYLGTQAPQQNFAALANQAHTIQLDAQALHWFDWGRYSSRQQQSMKLGGLVGTLHLHGDLTTFSDLLHWGQWLHIGKETTFGLGHYTLK